MMSGVDGSVAELLGELLFSHVTLTSHGTLELHFFLQMKVAVGVVSNMVLSCQSRS